MIGWGLVMATLAAWPQGWARLPVIGDALPIERVEGARAIAAQVDSIRRDLREQTGDDPMVIGGTYGITSQMAFYLPDRPTGYSGQAYLGWRESQYDLWEETNLRNPALHGRPAVMVLQEAELWQSAFDFEGFETVQEDPPLHAATEFGGPLE
jgi:hypothetical protein